MHWLAPYPLQIPILANAPCDTEAEVEAAITLTKPQIAEIAKAQKMSLHLSAVETGTADISITGLEMSFDGTNFFTILTFAAAIALTGTGAHIREITEAARSLMLALETENSAKLRLACTVNTLDGANYFTLSAALRLI